MMMSLWGPGKECGSKNRFSAHLTEHIGGSRPEKCHRSHIATSIHFPRRIHNTTKSCGGRILRTALYGERMAMMAVVGHFLMCGLIRQTDAMNSRSVRVSIIQYNSFACMDLKMTQIRCTLMYMIPWYDHHTSRKD